MHKTHTHTHTHIIIYYILKNYIKSYIFRGCLWQPLYCFHFDFRYVTLDIYIYIYIYIICVPTRNSNNEFILYFILREIKMADFERRQLEFGLEFVRYSFAERNNLSEGSSERRKDLQVIRVRGAAAPRVFELELLVFMWIHN